MKNKIRTKINLIFGIHSKIKMQTARWKKNLLIKKGVSCIFCHKLRLSAMTFCKFVKVFSLSLSLSEIRYFACLKLLKTVNKNQQPKMLFVSSAREFLRAQKNEQNCECKGKFNLTADKKTIKSLALIAIQDFSTVIILSLNA